MLLLMSQRTAYRETSNNRKGCIEVDLLSADSDSHCLHVFFVLFFQLFAWVIILLRGIRFEALLNLRHSEHWKNQSAHDVREEVPVAYEVLETNAVTDQTEQNSMTYVEHKADDAPIVELEAKERQDDGQVVQPREASCPNPSGRLFSKATAGPLLTRLYCSTDHDAGHGKVLQMVLAQFGVEDEGIKRFAVPWDLSGLLSNDNVK